LNAILQTNSDGLFTSRDHLTVRWSSEEVWETVQDFISLPPEEARDRYHLGKDVRDWKVELAQSDVRKSGPDRQRVVPILYRPFDTRFTYYTGHSRGFICMPRPAVMRHMLAERNLALISARSNKSPSPDHFYCTRLITEKKCGESTTQSGIFPLYLYPTKMFEGAGRVPNLNPAFLEDLTGRIGLSFLSEGRGDLESTFGPEDVFFYAYAVFHSPTYRQRYVEFLKGDFARLPLTGNKGLFAALVGLGAELVFLHLMESSRLENFITRFPIPGPQVVEGVRYEDSPRRVYINSEQYFEGIPPDVWAFTIGGYQVCHKWLKDRKGRTLTFEDLHHYQRIVVALAETIRLMGEIDAAIDAHGGWPGAFQR
jgi:predicted helicase